MNNLPVGFSMALAQNEAAMRRFASMTEPDRRAILQRAKQVRTKAEMRHLVSGLTD